MYNKQAIISYIARHVEDECKKETNIFGFGIWSNHIVYVVQYGKLLSNLLGANPEIVEIAALLHDIAGIKNAAQFEQHHIWGAQEAERILLTLKYPKDKIQIVKQCIISHRGSINVTRVFKEEICLASADAMAHIDQVLSLLYFAYNRNNMSIEEGKSWVRNKLKRSWEKMCPEAKDIIRDKYESLQLIFK